MAKHCCAHVRITVKNLTKKINKNWKKKKIVMRTRNTCSYKHSSDRNCVELQKFCYASCHGNAYWQNDSGSAHLSSHTLLHCMCAGQCFIYLWLFGSSWASVRRCMCVHACVCTYTCVNLLVCDCVFVCLMASWKFDVVVIRNVDFI